MSPPLAPVGRWWRSIRPRRRDLRADGLAGLTGAVASVPDGMAASVLAGVNPVYGLYASMAGPAVGGLATSTRMMVVTTTGAAALAAGSAIEGVDAADRPGTLFLLTLLAGAAMVAAGLLRLGRYTRFVSHSVMTGFLVGVAVNIITGQLADLTGAEANGSVALVRALDIVVHPSRIDPAALGDGPGRARHPVAERPDAAAGPGRVAAGLAGPDRDRADHRRRRGAGRRRRADPERAPAPGAARARPVHPGARGGSAVDRGDRAGAGRRRGGGRAEPGRAPGGGGSRLRRPGGRQPGVGPVAGHPRRRVGGPDGDQRGGGCPIPLGRGVVGCVDAGDPGGVRGRRRRRVGPHARGGADLRGHRIAAARRGLGRSCAPGRSRRWRSPPPSSPRWRCRSPPPSASGWPCRSCSSSTRRRWTWRSCASSRRAPVGSPSTTRPPRCRAAR